MDTVEKNSVLIVDDEKINLEVLREILYPEYAVYMTKSASAAIEMANKYLPDLILLDIIMPDMNGFDVLVTLKTSEQTKNIPIIIITGLDSDEYEEKGLALNAADFIRKPFSNNIVLARVRNQLQIVNHLRTINHYAHNMHLTLTKMEAIVNNYKGIIWSVDNAGIITTFNGQYLKAAGIEPESLVGKNIHAVRDEFKYADFIDSSVKAFHQGLHDWSGEIDGRMFHSQTTPMYNNNGTIIGIVGSTDDVTELIEMHAALAASDKRTAWEAS